MIGGALRRFLRHQGGTAAIELAGVGGLLIVAALNTAEVGRYAWQATQVTQAAQAGAEAALVTCDTNHTPATLNCPGLNNAVTQAIQGTRLGSHVMLNGPITEGYYCRNTSGGLTKVSGASDKAVDCSAAADAASGADPALYLQVNVALIFQPMFPGLTVASGFREEITRAAWMRMA
jgi:Flp pilus assembly protein TadG